MPSPTDAPSREETLIAQLRGAARAHEEVNLLTSSSLMREAIDTLTALLARLSEVEKALRQIEQVRIDNAADTCDKVMTLNFIGQIARAALSQECVGFQNRSAWYQHQLLTRSDAILTLVIDECAKVAEGHERLHRDMAGGYTREDYQRTRFEAASRCAGDIASAIRALHPKEPQG